MKNKKVLTLLLVMLMVCTTAVAAYVPAFNAGYNASKNTGTTTGGSGLNDGVTVTDVTGKYDTGALAAALNTDAMLTMSDVAELTGDQSPVFSSEDEVWVIVQLSDDSLVSRYNNGENEKYSSIDKYLESSSAKGQAAVLEAKQTVLMAKLLKAGIAIEFKYNYTSVMNAFAANVRYGDIAKIKAYNDVENVIVSELYAEPTVDVTENFVNVYESTGIFNSSDCGYAGEGMVVAVLDTGINRMHEAFQHQPDSDTMAMDRSYISSMLASGKLKASSIYNGLSVDDVYYSDKIPYAFDYADDDPDAYPGSNPHGVHGSGVIVGKSDVITGVAPEAQLATMKVFSEEHSGAYQMDILAALEDSVALGVDAINMSLGSTSGFATAGESGIIDGVFNAVREAGITLCVAAGNEYNSYMNSAYGSSALTSNPDTGTIGSPGSYYASFTVASISGVKTPYIVANGETAAYFDNAVNPQSVEYDFFDMLLGEQQSRVFEYVTVPGIGYPSDYDALRSSGIDISGKIALVKRGTSSFEDKASAAYAAGAAGIIIYNNTTGMIRMSIGKNLDIAACSINKEVGDILASRQTGTMEVNRANLAGPFMSDFSSWGPLPSLTLEPDITAHGGDILSAVTGYDQYAIQSGTSMATPNLAGVVLLVRQYLQEKYPDITASQLWSMTQQLIMSTATIAYNEEGNPYSPRKQGAGLANLDGALATQGYLTVDGSDYAKLSLYDDPERTGKYELEFNVVNMGTTALNYTLNTKVMTEQCTYVRDYKVWTILEKAYMFTDSKIEVSVTNGTYTDSTNTVSVPAGQTAKLKVTITLAENEIKYLEDNFENGMYVEGFVELLAGEGGVDLSIPYLAFYGSWLDQKMFWEDYYEVEESANDASVLDEDKVQALIYPTTPLAALEPFLDEEGEWNAYLLPLGMYPYTLPDTEKAINPDTEKAALTYDEDGLFALYQVYMNMVRGGKKVDFTITNKLTGEVIHEESFENVRKAGLGSPTFLYNGNSLEEDVDFYDQLLLTPSRLSLANNTQYTATITGYVDYKDGIVPNNTYSFDFRIDNENPVLTKVEYRTEIERDDKKNPIHTYMDLYVYDNQYAAAVLPCFITGENQNATLQMLSSHAIPVRGERRSVTKVSWDITEYLDYADENYDFFFIQLTDYALNTSMFAVTLPRDVTDVQLKETELTLSVGELYEVTPIVTPDDQWTDGFVWSSSNEDVVKVQDGEIYAVGKGTATVTVVDKDTLLSNDPRWEGAATIRVTVLGEGDDGYVAQKAPALEDIETTFYEYLYAHNRVNDDDWNPNYPRFITGTVKIYPGEKIKIDYVVKPWYIDLSNYDIEWKSSNTRYVTYSQDQYGNDEITAVKEGSATVSITLRPKAGSGISGVPFSAYVNIEVLDPYIISNYVLTRYYGVGELIDGVMTAELPDDEMYNAIGDDAFAGNTSIEKVIIPQGVGSIGKRAFKDCKNLKEVVLPEHETAGKTEALTTIGEDAFRDCLLLSKINIGSGEGCAPVNTIFHRAFMNCKHLTDVDFSTMSWLGDSVFEGCTAIKTANIPYLATAGSNVFGGCSSLTSVEMSVNTAMGEGMFRNTSITRVTIPQSKVAAMAFYGCARLSEVNFTGAVTEIGDSAFNGCSGLSKVSFTADATLEKIGVSVFAGASKLKSFNVASGNTNFVLSEDKAVVYNADQTEIVMIAPGYNFNNYTFASTLKSLGRGIFSGRTDIIDLDLSDTDIEVIGDYAFYGNTVLQTITFPDSLKRIGEGAFGVCYALDEIVIPAGVEVGARAYYNCVASNSQSQIVDGPQKITIGDGAVIGQEAFAVCEGVFSLELGNDVTLGAGAFYLCSNLGRGTVELGNLTEIPEACFGLNLSLENIDLSGVKKIGANAFSTNYNGQVAGGSLTRIDLSSVEELGDYAFFGQMSLEDVTLGSGLKEISKYAFAYCVTLSEINLDSVEIIREGAFFYNIGSTNLTDTYPGAGLTELNMPEVRIVEAGAFEYALWVEKVNMPKVEEVGEMAFSGLLATATDSSGNQWNVILSSLKEVTLPTDSEIDVVLNNGAFYLSGSLETINCERVVSMGDAVFMYCMSVKEINAPECTEIGQMCFYQAESATKIYVPLIEEVPDGAFLGTEALTSVDLPNVVRFGVGAFNGTGLESFTFTQKEIESIGDGVFAHAKNLHEFTRTVNGKTTDSFNLGSGYFVEDGVLYGTLPNGGYQLLSYPAQKEDRVYTVLDNTVRIGTGAGAGSDYLEVLVLPRTLKTIGDSAFYDCEKLKTIEFRSYIMPELEGITTNDYNKVANNVGEIFQPGENIVYYNMAYEAVWYLYFNLGGQLGVAEDIVAIVPENGVGYDNWLTNLYFDYIIKGANAKADETVAAEELINELPDVRSITLKDETAIAAARAAYNLIPNAQQRSMITSAYNTLVAAEERIQQLKSSSKDPGEPTDPETPVVDEKDETIKKLKTTVIVLAIVAGVIALGFVAYVVFDIVRKNKAVCAEAEQQVDDKKEE